MNPWPTNENAAGQILTVALSVLLDVCVCGGGGGGGNRVIKPDFNQTVF